MTDHKELQKLIESLSEEEQCQYCEYSEACPGGVRNYGNGPVYPPCADVSIQSLFDVDGYLKQREELFKYYFTFGSGQPRQGCCQPIYASSSVRARELMFETYGDQWAFQYTEAQWEEAENNPNRPWPMETELEPIYSIEEEE